MRSALMLIFYDAKIDIFTAFYVIFPHFYRMEK